MIKRIIAFSAILLMAINVNATCGIDKVGCSLFSISPMAGYYSYREPGLMSIKGPSFGLDGNYQYIDRNKVTLIVDGQLGFVNGKYDGRLLNGQPFQMENDNSYILGIAPKLGYVFSWQRAGLKLTPYIGLGYRYLHNDSSNNSAGYLRISNYFYIPVGADISWHMNKFIIQSRLELDGLIHGTQYSGIDGGISNQQREGWGANGYILLGREQGGWAWLIGPYIKYWKVQTSEVASGNTNKWIEPENNTVDVGLMIKFIF
ncbi:hypothetical protein [Cysteiniphilum halobium]|uniref:hypothetical protein n=1 Tax=Cysteiniphilum halobium TaxID=2219059 RepID=UPI003F87CAA1